MPRTSTRQAAAALARGQAGIQSFARATKPGVAARQSAKELVPNLSASPSKKRKLNELENVDGGSPTTTTARGKGEATTTTTIDAIATAPAQAETPSKSLRFSELHLSTPRSGHYVSPSRSTSGSVRGSDRPATPNTPSKRARARSTQEPACEILDTRPPAVHDLLRLHAAFLKALTFHAAHHGPATPADVREIMPSVERLWKKRKVTVKDLQRLLWINEQGTTDFTGSAYRLANYGLGRVCLERVSRPGQKNSVDEAERQEQFEQAVDLLWEKALDAAEGDESRVDLIATLGVATVHESLTPFTSFRKGQQRLQDLKGGVIRLKTEKQREPVQTEAPADKSAGATTNRRMGLLDRIKSKQMRQSQLPPPPTKEALLRQAAAQRVEEVASVVALMRPAGYVGSGPTATVAAQRAPHRMENIIQSVQHSMRNPIADREVEICLEIMARADIAGQWVNLVTVNQVKTVVLKSCSDVHPKEIGARACRLNLAEEDASDLESRV